MTSVGNEAFKDCASITVVYCFPDPENLTWNDSGKDDFKSDGSTVCHVRQEYLETYQFKFNDTVNVTFAGDLS